MNYELAIFDMDGTILDTLQDLHDTLNYVLGMHHFPLRTIDETRRFVGNGIRKLVERALPAGSDDATIDRVFASFKEYYKDHCAVATKPYDGITELLKELREAGIKTAVVSNKADFAVQELCETYFKGLFDCAVGEREGVRRKPSPDSVYAVLEKLAVAKEHAVYIGDSDVDLATAENAGLPCIAVTWGFRDRDFLEAHGASEYAKEPMDILKLLELDSSGSGIYR